MIEPLDSIQRCIAIADGWQRKGKPVQSLHCLGDALNGYMQHAVRRVSRSQAMNWLQTNNVERLLVRYGKNLSDVRELVDAGKWPSSVIAGNYPHLVHCQMAWLFGDYAIGDDFLAIARREDVLELSTAFWSEYSRGLQCLADRHVYRPAELKLRGPEQFWVSYLRLMSGAASAEPLESALAEVDDSFLRRNAAGTLDDDSYGIDGCAEDPVQWDFRRDAIMDCINRIGPAPDGRGGL